MAKELKDGLVEPSTVDRKKLNEYMQTTYSGYMTEINHRFRSFDHAKLMHSANGGGIWGYKNVDVEFFAIQIRMIMELIGYSVSSFEQAFREKEVTRKQRNLYDPSEVLKKLRTSYSWPKTIHPKHKLPNINGEKIQLYKVKYSDPNVLFTDYGRLGNILHAQQRPRTTGQERLQLHDLFDIADNLRGLIQKHIIQKNGEGWCVDTTQQSEGLNISMWACTYEG